MEGGRHLTLHPCHPTRMAVPSNTAHIVRRKIYPDLIAIDLLFIFSASIPTVLKLGQSTPILNIPFHSSIQVCSMPRNTKRGWSASHSVISGRGWAWFLDRKVPCPSTNSIAYVVCGSPPVPPKWGAPSCVPGGRWLEAWHFPSLRWGVAEFYAADWPPPALRFSHDLNPPTCNLSHNSAASCPEKRVDLPQSPLTNLSCAHDHEHTAIERLLLRGIAKRGGTWFSWTSKSGQGGLGRLPGASSGPTG